MRQPLKRPIHNGLEKLSGSEMESCEQQISQLPKCFQVNHAALGRV
jgi:hypothetical protein